MKKLITVILAIVFLILCAFSIFQVMRFNHNDTKHATLQHHDIVGQSIQNEQVTTLNSKSESLSRYLTKEINIINIWASWCDPCKKETPELIKLYQHIPNDVSLTGLNVKDKSTPRNKFIKSYQPNYPIVIANENFMKQYKVNFVPTTLFVSKQGKVLGIYTGELTEQHLNELIKAAREKQ